MDRSDFSPAIDREPSRFPLAPLFHDGQVAMDSSGLFLRDVIHLLEEQGQIGFWCHDLATDRITASEGLARIIGVPPTVIRTRESMIHCIHPQDRPYQDDHVGLVDIGQPLRREFRIVRPDGTIRWVSLRIDVMLDDDGRPLRFIGIMVDITERREAMRAVEFNQQRRVALLEAVRAQSWVGVPSSHPLDRAAWCELTGMSAEQCAADWLDAVHPDDRDRLRAAAQKAMAHGSLFDVDYRILHRDGTYLWFNARSAPVRDASHVIREWQGVLLAIDGEHSAAASDADEVPTLSGAQIRGARGLLDWSLAQLASASGVSVSTIKRMEDGSEGSTRASKSEAVRRALQAGGIAFRTIDGVTWISR